MRRSKRLNLVEFDPEIEQTFHQRRREQRAKREQQQSTMDDNENQLVQVERTVEINERDILMGDFMMPPVVENRSSIVYPPYGHDNFQLRPDVINLFSNNIPFYGRIDENPHYHLSRFLEYCGNFKYQGINEEAMRMRLFPHNLKDKAREWLDSLSPGSITTWADLVHKFTLKYFPPAKISKLKHEISTFQQAEIENFHEAWERYKELLRKCPNHGFSLPVQNHYFYAGLTPYSRSTVDSTAGGSIRNKSAGELHDLFETMSEQFVMWPDRSSNRRAVGVHEVDMNTLMLAKIDALSKQMENLKYSPSVNMVQGSLPVCVTCGANHLSSECPLTVRDHSLTEQAAYAQNFPRQQNFQRPQNNPYSPTYNPGWRNHPNFSYGNNQGIQNPPKQGTPHEEKGGWEAAISKLQERSEQTDAAIKNIETQIGQLAKILTERQQGTWPSNTEVNPKEQANAITTRSGVQLPEIHVKRPSMEKKTDAEKEIATENKEPEDIAEQEKVVSSPIKPYVPPIPFPQRLRKHKLDKQFEKFLEVFKKLHINIPFAEALSQMPSYAKFMKEIISNKRKLEEHETVMLTEECSAILQNKLPPKLKDLGSFTIPCTIGSLYFERSLCDLGASINLMPFSIFQKLGLGEAKPTRVSLQLADRCVKHPRGIVKDILVKVDKFIFPADFIILDMAEDRDIPLILG
ncbi:uncharacterized protein LOC127804544 [Diospyros lotus]|uniref:uncharacterized protein LOC127804544 n=1 Tax=Diospyros lotus TaxID=55363 RepID=UPI00224CF293|nr:uncharacterized protein LOC127804544 [Diospyros lotus]